MATTALLPGSGCVMCPPPLVLRTPRGYGPRGEVGELAWAGVLPSLRGFQEPVMLGSVSRPPFVSPAISGCPELAATVPMLGRAWMGVGAPPLTGYSVT